MSVRVKEYWSNFKDNYFTLIVCCVVVSVLLFILANNQSGPLIAISTGIIVSCIFICLERVGLIHGIGESLLQYNYLVEVVLSKRHFGLVGVKGDFDELAELRGASRGDRIKWLDTSLTKDERSVEA